jgi:dCTP deaminase
VLASDADLDKMLADGRLSIEPYEPPLLQPASIDLRLDRLFEIFNNHRYPAIDPSRAQPGLTETVEVDDGKPFVLHPREFVLASTYERVTFDATIAGRAEGKSSLGRLGLLVHSTAGFIDPGFSGHITLELSNVSNLPILLWPGMRVGQLCVFLLATPSREPYGAAACGSHYQNQPRGPQPSRSARNFRTWPVRSEEPTDA